MVFSISAKKYFSTSVVPAKLLTYFFTDKLKYFFTSLLLYFFALSLHLLKAALQLPICDAAVVLELLPAGGVDVVIDDFVAQRSPQHG